VHVEIDVGALGGGSRGEVLLILGGKGTEMRSKELGVCESKRVVKMFCPVVMEQTKKAAASTGHVCSTIQSNVPCLLDSGKQQKKGKERLIA